MYAFGTELWLGMVNIRIHRPKMRRELTALNDCDPPLTWAIARVRPCVGRTEPDDSGIQSICCLKMPVWSQRVSLVSTLSPGGCSATGGGAYQVTVLLWADPDVAVAPLAELSEFLHLGVGMLHIVLLWQARRVVHADIAAETEQDPGALVG